MTKEDLVHVVYKNTGFTKSKVKIVVDEVLNSIKKGVLEDGIAEFREFGIFSVYTKPAKTVNTSANGTKIISKEKNVVRFKPLF